MFAALQLEIDGAKQTEYRDVLGQILTAMQINDESNDQFFTPTHIAEFMGQLCYSDKDFANEIKQCGYCVLREPTCGGGALVFGGVEAFRRKGLDPEEQLVVIATDLDERCVLMTYVQCAMYKIPAIVQQRNFMTNESLSPPWYTPMFVFYNWKERLLQPLWAETKDASAVVEEKPPAVKRQSLQKRNHQSRIAEHRYI